MAARSIPVMAHHWSPRELLHASGRGEWLMIDEGVKVAVVRLVKVQGRDLYRAVTYDPDPDRRVLLGYFPDMRMLAHIVYREWLRVNGKSTDLPPR